MGVCGRSNQVLWQTFGGCLTGCFDLALPFAHAGPVGGGGKPALWTPFGRGDWSGSLHPPLPEKGMLHAETGGMHEMTFAQSPCFQ